MECTKVNFYDGNNSSHYIMNFLFDITAKLIHTHTHEKMKRTVTRKVIVNCIVSFIVNFCKKRKPTTQY